VAGVPRFDPFHPPGRARTGRYRLVQDPKRLRLGAHVGRLDPARLRASGRDGRRARGRPHLAVAQRRALSAQGGDALSRHHPTPSTTT
jgi:hypothetical protein